MDNTVFTLKCDHSLTKHITEVPQWDNKMPAKGVADQPLGKAKKSKKNVGDAPKMVGDLELENVGGF